MKEKKRKGKKGTKRKMRCDDEEEEDEQTILTKKIDVIDAKVSKVLDVNAHLPLPLGLSTLLYEAFKCSICLRSPIVPPAIIGKCCKRIIGCQRCIDAWYKDGDTLMKRCPLCQKDRGYTDTMLLLGVDELLIGIAGILSPRDREAHVQKCSDIQKLLSYYSLN